MDQHRCVTDDLPMPPWPDPDDPVWIMLLDHISDLFAKSPGSLPDKIDDIMILAAAHGWYEGYINAAGESARPTGPVSDSTKLALLIKRLNRAGGPPRRDFSTNFADTVVSAAMADLIRAIGVIEYGVDEVGHRIATSLEEELPDLVARLEKLQVVLDAQ